MYLGIDTSNYTTSLALFDGENIKQAKKILNVKKGERGLRQSEAVFQHTVNMPGLFPKLCYNGEKLNAIGVSKTPRDCEGSYMPCFNVGLSVAAAISEFSQCSVYKTSHQTGHILAALYSAKRLDLCEREFVAFHVSGGTTEALLVKPDREKIISAEIIAQSTDLKAGQAVDRTGVLLGLDFPCGREVDRLSLLSDRNFKIKPSVKGTDCSLSGVENKVKDMIAAGESAEDISKFALSYISAAICEMTRRIVKKYGDLPLVYAGGVMSNTLIRRDILSDFNADFAQSDFSCDNAAGVAVYAYLKDTE